MGFKVHTSYRALIHKTIEICIDLSLIVDEFDTLRWRPELRSVSCTHGNCQISTTSNSRQIWITKGITFFWLTLYNYYVNPLYCCWHRIKISNRRVTQRCNVSSFFYAKICSLLARRRSSQPVQRVYWPENVIDWLGKWRPTCVMRHARGQKLQSFRRKWPFYMDLYSMVVDLMI